MFPSRYMPGQSSAVRKTSTRPTDVRPSMLPKPRRPGSTDRVSVDARRPSGSQRSSSAEPSRATLAGSRLSREASASKLPLNRRSRSQQAERHYGQSSMTPLRGSHYPRATTTPVRTPSEDRMNRGWQASVERALAFLTIRDQRPVSNMAWQRAEVARVQEALAARGEGGAGIALIRPLTITRFVEITGELFSAIIGDCKLNNDNYVAKLPNLAKRFLYPGAVSKSWLKTVNTLHAFPHALAFISYFLDLVNHIELPVSDEWLYLEKDDLACLRRDYFHKCWLRFQDPGHEFEDLNQEYLQQLKLLLGDDEQRIEQLNQVIEDCEAKLGDETELAARAEEDRLRARRDALAAALRAVRAERRAQHADMDMQRDRRAEHASVLKTLDADIANATAEIQQLKKEIETQPLTVAERSRLAGEAEYAARVIDSKKTLAEQVAKMIQSKEEELGAWQKRALDSCVEYKQALIHLSAQFPELATLAVDEKELMFSSCLSAVCAAVEALRAHGARLHELRAERARARTKLARQADHQLEETKAKIIELKSTLEREQRALESELTKESSEAATWAAEKRVLGAKLTALAASEEACTSALSELQMWVQQEAAWRGRLTEMHAYIEELTEQCRRELEVEKRRRADVVKGVVAAWHARLDEVEEEERALELAENEKGKREIAIQQR